MAMSVNPENLFPSLIIQNDIFNRTEWNVCKNMTAKKNSPTEQIQNDLSWNAI